MEGQWDWMFCTFGELAQIQKSPGFPIGTASRNLGTPKNGFLMGNSGYELKAVDSQFDQFVFLGRKGWLCPCPTADLALMEKLCRSLFDITKRTIHCNHKIKVRLLLQSFEMLGPHLFPHIAFYDLYICWYMHTYIHTKNIFTYLVHEYGGYPWFYESLWWDFQITTLHPRHERPKHLKTCKRPSTGLKRKPLATSSTHHLWGTMVKGT